MITISPEQEIFRDEEFIGHIVGTTAHVNEELAGRIKGQIRTAAGIPDLSFTIASPQAEAAPEFPSGSVLSARMDAGTPSDDGGPATISKPVPTWDLTGFPPPSNKKQFKRQFINTFGPPAFEAYLKTKR